MDRQTYRKQFVNQEKLLNPHRKIGKAYAKRILQPRGYTMLQSIRAEITPKLQAIRLAQGNMIEDCPFDTSPFNNYQKKGTMGEVQVTCGKGSRYKETFGQGRQTEPDLASVNSVRFETVEREMVPDNSAN